MWSLTYQREQAMSMTSATMNFVQPWVAVTVLPRKLLCSLKQT
jgi:hypothetical protein